MYLSGNHRRYHFFRINLLRRGRNHYSLYLRVIRFLFSDIKSVSTICVLHRSWKFQEIKGRRLCCTKLISAIRAVSLGISQNQSKQIQLSTDKFSFI